MKPGFSPQFYTAKLNFSANKYTMFRLDRSEDSHPADQSNRLKFKRN